MIKATNKVLNKSFIFYRILSKNERWHFVNRVSQFDKKVANNVAHTRRRLEISVEDIAEFLYVDASFVRSVECYDKKYNLRHLYLIMALFMKADDSITLDSLMPKCSENIIKILQNDTKSKIKAWIYFMK